MAILQTPPPPHPLRSPPPQLLRSPPPLRSRRMLSSSANGIKCSLNQESNVGSFQKHVLAGLCASVMFTSPGNMVFAAESSHHNNVFDIAIARKSGDILKIDGSDDGNTQMFMMRGMTAKDFDPSRYAGRWFEVASLKRGFAGQGQEDCHCTQGVYTYDPTTPSIQVDTFCIHGGPDGYITGIRGKVQCLSEEDIDKTETDLERKEMIKEKCFLRFPTLPFIPKEPYDVIATDYDNFALVSGAKDNSFIQIYSRTPDPGPDFIDKYKSYLSRFGYDSNAIKNTPQDCQVMSSSQLSLLMSKSGMEEALTNQFPDLELNAAVEFNPLSNAFVTLRKLVELYFK